MCSKQDPFHALPPLVRQVGPLCDRNFRPTIRVIEGCCAREGLPHAFNISVFQYSKSNSTTIKHIYNESVNFNESCDIPFDINNWWYLPWTVSLIGVESMVTQAGLRYTRDYLTPGICRPIKPAAIAKLISRQNLHSLVIKSVEYLKLVGLLNCANVAIKELIIVTMVPLFKNVEYHQTYANSWTQEFMNCVF